MAPRRGASFNYHDTTYEDYQNAKNKCLVNEAFKRQDLRIYISFYSVFFLMFLILLGAALAQYCCCKRKRQPLKSISPLVLSVILNALALALLIVFFSLSQCGIVFLGERSSLQGEIAASWLSSIARLILIVVIMMPICKKLHQTGNSWIATLVTRLHTLWVILLTLLLLTTLSLETRNDNLHDKSSPNDSLTKHTRDVRMAYYVLVLAGILMAVASITTRLIRLRFENRALVFWTSLLIFGTLGMAIFDVAAQIYSRYDTGRDHRGAENLQRFRLIQVFLTNFFYVVAFLGAMQVVRSPIPTSQGVYGVVTCAETQSQPS